MNTDHPAYKYFCEKWNDEKHRIHCNCVVEICLQAITNTRYNPDIFIIAGWIHDMGKLVNKELHHEKSIEFLDEFLSLHPRYAPLKPVLVDCIRNHRRNGVPATIEGELFKVADKIALARDEWIAYKKL